MIAVVLAGLASVNTKFNARLLSRYGRLLQFSQEPISESAEKYYSFGLRDGGILIGFVRLFTKADGERARVWGESCLVSKSRSATTRSDLPVGQVCPVGYGPFHAARLEIVREDPGPAGDYHQCLCHFGRKILGRISLVQENLKDQPVEGASGDSVGHLGG